jgi:serine acetyltransferase
VWIGYGATILSGVTIGHGAVIGAMSLVTRDVPPFGIAVGNPARVVRSRLGSEAQKAALDTLWWQKSTGDIISNVQALNDDPVSQLLDRELNDE